MSKKHTASWFQIFLGAMGVVDYFLYLGGISSAENTIVGGLLLILFAILEGSVRCSN